MTQAYHVPRTLDAALELVAAGAVPLAGATGLYAGHTRRDVAFCDVTRLGLDGVTVEPDRILIGAAVTLTGLARASELPGIEGALLRGVAGAVASHPLRNAITVGGNLAHACYWADLPPVLLALDATLEICRAGAPPELVPLASSACAGGGRPWAGGLITRVLVPRGRGRRGFGHERFVRTANDYSLATACAVLRRDGDVARDVRVVVSAVHARAGRLAAVEALLEGKPLDDALLGAAEERLRAEVAVGPSFRAPAEYRRRLAATLTRRALAAAWTRAAGEG